MKALSGLFKTVTMAPLKSKLRLWIEYGLLLVIICTASIAFWNYHKQATLTKDVAILDGKLEAEKVKSEALKGVVDAQAITIQNISDVREVDSATLKSLVDDFHGANKRNTAVTQRLASLERNSEIVRQYLTASVPDDVGCVLDSTCAEADHPKGSASPAPARSAPGAVRTSPARSQQVKP